MAQARPNVNNRHRELPDALVESLARLLAEVLVLEYRTKTEGEVDQKAAAVNSPTGIHREEPESPATID